MRAHLLFSQAQDQIIMSFDSFGELPTHAKAMSEFYAPTYKNINI